MITINASTITNNLLSNKSYSYQISKQGYKFDSNAESCSVNVNNFKKQLRHLKCRGKVGEEGALFPDRFSGKSSQ